MRSNPFSRGAGLAIVLMWLAGVARADIVNGNFDLFTVEGPQGLLPDGWETYEGAMEYTHYSPDGMGLTLSPYGRLGQHITDQPLVSGATYKVSFLLGSTQPAYPAEELLVRFLDTDADNLNLGQIDLINPAGIPGDIPISDPGHGGAAIFVPKSFSFTVDPLFAGHNWWLYINSYNGVTNLDNVQVSVSVPLPGDVNFDGLVNIFDINLVSANWNGAGPTGDANHDGTVNIFDINLISSNWTPASGGGAAVPEPASGVLLIAGGVAAGVWRLRRRGRINPQT